MVRRCSAKITLRDKRGTRTFKLAKVQAYRTEQSIDNDTDSFSVDISDVRHLLAAATHRDTEVEVDLFINSPRGMTQIFSGIADESDYTEDTVLSIAGRDVPSAVADSDASPMRKKFFSPHEYIAERARALGIRQTRIAKMGQIKKTPFVTDGSETEWQVWYRMARQKGMYIWATRTGGLVVDKLAYGAAPAYKFGAGGVPVISFNDHSSKSSRKRKVIGYGEDAKSGGPLSFSATDPALSSWRRKPVTIFTSSGARSQQELAQEVDEEIIESKVGANELEITVHDTGIAYDVNKMVKVKLPEHGIKNEDWFVVGVTRTGGEDGMLYTLRLREKAYALPVRVPREPSVDEDETDAALRKAPAASVVGAMEEAGVKYASYFMEATEKFGVKAGWDRGLFLGVLISIASIESGFRNIREGHSGSPDLGEWFPFGEGGKFESKEIEIGAGFTITIPVGVKKDTWLSAFANEGGNPRNPFRGRTTPDAGVGIMQLTTPSYKESADKIGWDVKMQGGSPEYYGARWSPRANIFVGAQVLVSKLKSANANPTNPNSIWLGVERYNGSGPKARAYAATVKQTYESTYKGLVQSGFETAQAAPQGTGSRTFRIPIGKSADDALQHKTFVLPSVTPAPVAKGMTFAVRAIGPGSSEYVWGGNGELDALGRPKWDCSGFVTSVLRAASPQMVRLLGSARHTTYTYWKMGNRVVDDGILFPGDLVFFRGDPPEHMGIYFWDGYFIHCSSSVDSIYGKSGVKLSSLAEYKGYVSWSGARRIYDWPAAIASGLYWQQRKSYP